MSIACVILHYRNVDDTTACLSSLGIAVAARPEWKIFLVNNSPEDGSGDAIDGALRGTGIPYEVLTPASNTGFARGCNLGASAAAAQGYSHILLLNNDTVVADDFATQTERVVGEWPDAVIAGLITDEAGKATHNIGTISPWTGRVRHIFDGGYQGKVSFVSGCLMIVPAGVFAAVGLFDERLFMYAEDLDLCLRFRKGGYDIRFAPSIRILHKFDPAESRSGTPKEYYLQRNQTYVILRRGTLRQRAFYLAFLVALPFYKALRRPRLFSQAIRGAWDGLLGKMGKRHGERESIPRIADEGRAAGPKTSICLNALFLQGHLGGIGNYARQLALWLTRHRPEWDVSIMVPEPLAHAFGNIPGLRVLKVGVTSRAGRLLYFHLLFPFRCRGFSLLHSLGNMGLAVCPIPQVITVHDSYERVSPERFGWTKRKLMTFLIAASGARARRIIVNSRNTRKDVERFYPRLASKTEVIYMGTKFLSGQDAGPLPAPFPVGTPASFLFVGTIEPGKNLGLVLHAFADFLRVRGGRLRVVGAAGWKQTDIPALVHTLGIHDAVEFMGYVSDERLRDLYSASTALIQASSYEGFGLPVIEAMACGCPVIAAANSGLLEAGGDCALFFETGNRQELIARMMQLQDDPALRDRCARQGIVHAAKFSWDNTGRETARVYESILSHQAFLK